MKRFLAIALVATPLASGAGWVDRSNEEAQPLLKAMGSFRPEEASSRGQAEFDSQVVDLGPSFPERLRAAESTARDGLLKHLALETDPKVRQDLQIMIDAASLDIELSEAKERDLVPFFDVAQLVFSGEFALLNDQAKPDRRASALGRLKRYVGLVDGVKPLSELARERTQERMGIPGLLPPYRGEVQQALSNSTRFASGIRQLFENAKIDGADEALGRLDRQFAEYGDWLKRAVLPVARDDFKTRPELYALDLRQVGLEIQPDELIARAELAYSEISDELKTLAPLVAASHGWQETDYRDVIHRLKREQLGKDEIEPYYKNVVIPKIEEIVRTQGIATLPDRPMAMRIASEAESARQPAPHMQPPPLINNRGERGTFVLPLGNPAANGNANDAYDDFTFKASAWTLTAHEGRPGHELQFSRMVERGVSYARSIFAFNSVNVEGWALYCEAEMMPYEPLDGQLIVLQLRLQRAVRAIVDPELNLGRISRERAHEIMIHDVCLSEAFTREELDRFTFRSPGQATSYFYGYSKLMQLRGATEVALGSRFDHKAFNDFIVDQGLLPPKLLAQAVNSEFIPSRSSNPSSP